VTIEAVTLDLHTTASMDHDDLEAVFVTNLGSAAAPECRSTAEDAQDTICRVIFAAASFALIGDSNTIPLPTSASERCLWPDWVGLLPTDWCQSVCKPQYQPLGG
jgi:hypothetical protein